MNSNLKIYALSGVYDSGKTHTLRALISHFEKDEEYHYRWENDTYGVYHLEVTDKQGKPRILRLVIGTA